MKKAQSYSWEKRQAPGKPDSWQTLAQKLSGFLNPWVTGDSRGEGEGGELEKDATSPEVKPGRDWTD